MKKSLFLVFVIAVLAGTLQAATTLNLNATIRDFSVQHPDFEWQIAYETGIVQNTLGADGKPVYNPIPHITVNSQATFDQWYRNVPGVNIALPYTIIANQNAAGLYEYSNGAFFPIDGQGFGNEGNGHNYHFTMETHNTFTYKGGEVFNFTGDDDLWVFINKQLAIDLGGVHGAMSQSVNLDSLGLTVGNDYSFDLFFAERHTSESNFFMTTSIELQPAVVPAPGAALLVGVGSAIVGFLRKRKMM